MVVPIDPEFADPVDLEEPITKAMFVQILACVADAYTAALPVYDRRHVLEGFANELYSVERKTRHEDVRQVARALSARLMAMGH